MLNYIKSLWNQFFSRLKLNQKFTMMIVILVLVPTVIFTVILFWGMEDNAVEESRRNLEYTMDRSYDDITKYVDNISMSTQFFLSDRSLNEYLKALHDGEEISYERMMDFYNVNIADLERLVNNNPNIYQIRVYVDNTAMEEMMPILYRYDRMQKLAWADDKELNGWKFDYPDTIFDAYLVDRDKHIMSLVTPITEYDGEELGLLEAAVRMETMFPELYASRADSVSFFERTNGEIFCSEENREEVARYREMIQADLEEDDFLVASQYVKELDGTLYCVMDMRAKIGQLRQNRNGYIVALVLSAVALLFFINHMVNRLLAQFYQILASIRKVQKGNLDVEIENCGTDEMGELGTQINKMMERIRQLLTDNLNRERLAKNSEIRSLQNQINAHFIYNVLESIKMMAEIDEKYDISDAITSLGKLLRYSMHWVSGKVTVREELDYIQNYLALINLRFDYEIYLSLNLPEIVLKQEIPKMSLQPIVENAIYHGIEQLAEDTNIYVKGYLQEADCIIEVTDAGRGMSEETVQELNRKIHGEMENDEPVAGEKGNGIGLKNVQDRIQINFGEAYGLTVNSKLGCYTKVEIRVPQTHFETDSEGI
ncbi:MAG: histidine kinase [Acetatifactor sp.]|nr:histidine kinase [Acetatifactor sp.]